jgi:hypothetical protein
MIGSVRVYRAPNHGDNFLQLRGRQSTRQSIKEPLLWQYLHEVGFEKRWLRQVGFAGRTRSIARACSPQSVTLMRLRFTSLAVTNL